MDFLELELAAPASGGGCVAREDGKVYFVRHGIQGERVRAAITEDHGRWARADAMEVLEASPDRIDPACPFSGPTGCGGCDFQHVRLPRQRSIKRELVNEQLQRLARVEASFEVEAFDDGDGLATRTRIRYAVDAAKRLSMRTYRSHDTVPVDRCRLGVEEIQEIDISQVALVPGHDLQVVYVPGQQPDHPLFIDVDERAPTHHDLIEVHLNEFTYMFSPTSFWQIHRRAPQRLVDEVMTRLRPPEGGRVLDLYCGAGLFTQPLAHLVGPKGRVIGIDASHSAIDDARRNVASMSWVELHEASITSRSIRALGNGITHVVIDPPRSGCAKGVLQLLSQEKGLRTIVMVSCDPATFARDTKILLDIGWILGETQVFDFFEMTEHVELVATFSR